MADKIVLPELPELTFDEGPHVYRLNGVQIPSVSNIMEPLSRAKYDGVSDSVLQKAADRGTAVHNSIENFLKFEFEDFPPEHIGYVNAFKAWWDLMQPQVVGSEVRLYHKQLEYAGTLDLLCVVCGKLCLYDFKTTYQVSEMTCGVQLEAYDQGLQTHGIKVDEKHILHLKKDGKFKDISFPVDDKRRWKVFCELDQFRKAIPDSSKRSEVWSAVASIKNSIPDPLVRLKLFGGINTVLDYVNMA